MSPCQKHKQSIAWLCMGELEAAQAEALRSHLQTCPACRAYHEQLNVLTQRLQDCPQREIELSNSFHQQLRERIAREGQSAFGAFNCQSPGSQLRWAQPPSFSWASSC
jgi:anti-sigma factor RsiW